MVNGPVQVTRIIEDITRKIVAPKLPKSEIESFILSYLLKNIKGATRLEIDANLPIPPENTESSKEIVSSVLLELIEKGILKEAFILGSDKKYIFDLQMFLLSEVKKGAISIEELIKSIYSKCSEDMPDIFKEQITLALQTLTKENKIILVDWSAGEGSTGHFYTMPITKKKEGISSKISSSDVLDAFISLYSEAFFVTGLKRLSFSIPLSTANLAAYMGESKENIEYSLKILVEEKLATKNINTFQDLLVIIVKPDPPTFEELSNKIEFIPTDQLMAWIKQLVDQKIIPPLKILAPKTSISKIQKDSASTNPKPADSNFALIRIGGTIGFIAISGALSFIFMNFSLSMGIGNHPRWMHTMVCNWTN